MDSNLPLLPFHSLNDSEFICQVSQTISHNFPLNVIDQLIYNPSEPADRHSEDSLSNDIFREPLCKYYFCNDQTIKQSFTCPSINILSVNISSIPSHLESFLDQCIASLDVSFHVLGFCETRLNNDICELYNIDGFNAHFRNKSTSGGGLALYINKAFTCLPLHDITLQLPHIEALFLNVLRPHKFIIGIIYRPPNSNIHDFKEALAHILDSVSRKKMHCYIMGDFNINLLDNTDYVRDFSNQFFSHTFFPVINKPTRVTKISATIIDHFWTNNMHNYNFSGIIYTSISDHFPVFSSFSLPKPKSQNPGTKISKRIFSDERTESFVGELSEYNWRISIPAGSGVDEHFSTYMDQFLQLYNKHFPIKEVIIKDKHNNKPYITQGIRKSIKERNRLQKLYAKWPISYSNAFKNYRNSLTLIIRKAKQTYYQKRLEDNAGNSKKTWEILNNIMGKDKNQLPTSMTFPDKTSSSNPEIAELFNNYFCSIAGNLAQSVEHTPVSYKHFLPNPTPFSLYIQPTCTQEIENIIKTLKLSSPGADMIDIKIIKLCDTVISPYLKYIINRSFREGIFPRILQIARVVPVHKKGNKDLHNNYRPISVLPCISKIFEKIMASRLMNYLSEHSLLSQHQYGFRPQYNTELAVYQLCQNIYDAVDNKECQITLFCDLTKAFDTISHSILLDKLYVYGIRGPILGWFKSYLSHRKQYVVYNNAESQCNNIYYGIPQGSILGPLLFLIYINDITRSTNALKFLLFADDTNIFINGRDIKTMETIINQELSHVVTWIKCNKLTLNISKTNYMISHPLLTPTPSLSIKLDNLPVNSVNEMRFLGVILDNSLRWKSHIDYIKTKLCKISGILYRIREFMDEKSIRQIYFSLAYPHLVYCCAIWGGAFKSFIDNLFIEQKKLLRIMSGRQRYDHTHPLFLHYKLLKLPDLVSLYTCLFVHTALHSSPVHLNFNIIDRGNSRRGNNLRIPLCRTNHAQQSPLFRGPKLWNQLPQNITSCISRPQFKNKLKNILLEKYN